MSDYVHNKVIRLPFPKEILEECNTDDPWDCENYLKDKLGELWDHPRDKNSFKLGSSDKGYYLDWVYHSTYGEKSGDFGSVRLLTPKELGIILPYFNKLDIEFNIKDLRLVDYCYYNCCDAPDFYDLQGDGDDSHLFIN